jgi:hypothetical protein
MYGMLINGIQAAGLEHQGMKLASWNGMTSKAFLRSEISFAHHWLSLQ